MMDKRVQTGREEWLFGLAFLWVQFVLSASGPAGHTPTDPVFRGTSRKWNEPDGDRGDGPEILCVRLHKG